MREKKYSKEFGGTAGCSLRLIKESQYSGSVLRSYQTAKEECKQKTFFGDSWFISRQFLSALAGHKDFGHEGFCALKTNHSGTPKEEMEKIMKDWPSGSYLTVECEELKLFFVGYKYNYKKKGKSGFSEDFQKSNNFHLNGFMPSCFSVFLPWYMECWHNYTWRSIHCQMA